MPTIEIAGKQIETTEMGYLVNAEDWTKELAQAIADNEKLELTERHWDVINHLRDELTSSRNSSSFLLFSTTTDLQKRVSVTTNFLMLGFESFISYFPTLSISPSRL